MDIQTNLIPALGVAVAGAMLIGIDRERRKGTGPSRALAGIRTFTLAGLAGALAQAIGEPWLVAIGAFLIMALCGISYWRERSDDPGITTELALFLTYVLGVGAVEYTQLVSGIFVVVAALLASKASIHRFTTQVLTDIEIRDGLILAGAALVIFPLIPDRQIPFIANANPHHLWRLVVLLMALQALGHIAMRIAGAKFGLPLAGLASGIVSSTSTFAAMGARARQQPALLQAFVSGALFSNVSSMALLIPVAVAIYPQVLDTIWPLLVAGLGSGLIIAAVSVRKQSSEASHDAPSSQVFSIGQAIGFAALLTALTTAITLATGRFGTSAAEVGAGLAATIDMQAAAGTLFSLAAGESLSSSALRFSLLIAMSTNAAGKMVTAFLAGGSDFGWRVSGGLVATVAAMWATLLL